MQKQEILKKYFGYTSFREGQEILVDSILRGQDTLGIMPTGAGKSVCYQVPALMLSGITVVISPLISLMKDQVSSLNQAGIHAAYINSSLTENQIKKAMEYAINGQYKIIYVAPERLETYEFINFAQNAEISMVTVDEAHCISQWGQDFRPSYLKIVSFVKGLGKRPIISAFTATATEQVKEDIICVLGLSNPQVLVSGFDRKNLYFSVEKPKSKDRFIVDYIEKHKEDSGIIYCATRKNVEKVWEILEKSNVPAAKYHAGMDNHTRNENQEDFIYDRKPVMVATNAFGMGIDKSNVRFVIHYNMPQSMENYYQEAGRAGRDGEDSECILLYSGQDLIINRFLIENKEIKNEDIRDNYKIIQTHDELRLQQMNRYCLTTDCLRGYILQYFGEHSKIRCENCSNCQREYKEEDKTKEALQIIECVREMRGRYGINVVAGTLNGASRAKLREYHVEKFNAYGAMKSYNEDEIKQIINEMIEAGYLMVTQDKYALVKLGVHAQDLTEQNTGFVMKYVVVSETEKTDTESGAGKHRTRKSDVLNGRGLELFEQLRRLRTEIAKEEGVPPYIVFSDKTLVEMCAEIPFNREEMMRVAGVGENKFNKYGKRFIDEIFSFTNGIKEKTYFGERAVLFADNEISGYQSSMKRKTRRKSSEKSSFFINSQQAEAFPYKERYLVTELAVALTEISDKEAVKKLTGADIFRYVTGEGWADEIYIEGRRKKVIYEKGKTAGLVMGIRISKKETEYEDIYYTEHAQKLIVAHYTRAD